MCCTRMLRSRCGVVSAVGESVELIDKARQLGVPVIYTTVIFEDNGLDDHLMFLRKACACLFTRLFTIHARVRKVPSIRVWTKDNPLTEFCPAIAPKPGDRVINKKNPGAFWGSI